MTIPTTSASGQMRRGALLLLTTTLLCGAFACGDEEKKKGPRVVSIFMDGPVAETKRGTPFGPPVTSHHDVLKHLHELTDDKNVKGLFLYLGQLGGGFAQFAEIERAVIQFKGSDKKNARPVHCHFDIADNRPYAFLANVCDRISMGPGGMINLVGVSSQTVYLKELLDHLGIEVEVLHMGRFKGTGENLTRNESTPEKRQTMNAILDALQAELNKSVAKRTQADAAAVQALFDKGPFGSVEALEAKLVDDVGFDDEALEHLRQATKTKEIERRRLAPDRDEPSFADLIEAIAGSDERDPEGKRLAIVSLNGTILDGSQDSGDADRMHSGPFVRKLRALADDEQVKAIVLRVDSPGGSALASDRMWHAVRRAAARKPVIASFGNMAASGGYYVASAADEIFSEQESLVGSIGVVAIKPNVKQLLGRIGVHPEIFSRGKNATWLSPLKPLDAGEREEFHSIIERTYWRFIRRVASSREMKREDVLAVAGGRLMSGKKAMEGGLVDKQGGLADAIDRARELAKLDDDVELEFWPRDMSLLEMLQGRDSLDAHSALAGRGATAEFLKDLRILEALATSGVPLAYSPYWINFR